MNKRTTCGPMYLDALMRYAGKDEERLRIFAAGFIHGQAEKVYLGACSAAMFRVSPEFLVMVATLAWEAVDRYGLHAVRQLGDEIWILRDGHALDQFNFMAKMPVNSSDSHIQRGALCGVPFNEIDETFHERDGFGKPCDHVEIELPKQKETADA